jgi:hypothetical protein
MNKSDHRLGLRRMLRRREFGILNFGAFVIAVNDDAS